MKRPTLVTGLDIGSSKISAVAAEVDKEGAVTILTPVTQPSRGISRGAVVDLNEAVRSVTGALNRLRDKISGRPENIYVNISGESVKGAKSRGMIPLALRGREVTKADINRCVNAASTIHLPFDREIIHKIVRGFSVDDQPCVRNPLGLYASRLNCEVYIISAAVNHIQNIYKCVNSAGYDIKEVVFTGMADGAGLLDKTEMEEGSLLMDMGSSLTEASIFYGGSIADFWIIPTGAEELKDDFKESAGFNEMLAVTNSRLLDFLKAGGKVKSVTITGSLAFADGIAEFLEEKLSYPVKSGVAKGIRGDISGLDSVRLATAIGLIRYAHQKRERTRREEGPPLQRIYSKVTDIFNNYF